MLTLKYCNYFIGEVLNIIMQLEVEKAMQSPYFMNFTFLALNAFPLCH